MSKRKFRPFEKAFIQERANNSCEYCKFPASFSHDSFHIEHIIPPQFGGNDELINLAFSCDGCNSNKWIFIEGLDVETNVKVPLFNPRRDIWGDHFRDRKSVV